MDNSASVQSSVLTCNETAYIIQYSSNNNGTHYSVEYKENSSVTVTITISDNEIIYPSMSSIIASLNYVNFIPYEGVLVLNKSLLLSISHQENGNLDFIVADLAKKQLLMINGICITQVHKERIHINSNLYWKGYCKNNIPFGWGQLMTSNDHILYEGFRKDVNEICYGSYYNDNNDTIYTGYIINNAPWHFDMSTSSLITSTFINSFDSRIQFSNELTSIVFGKGCGHENNLTTILFTNFLNLKSIEIQDGAFLFCKHMHFYNLPCLEEIQIGEQVCLGTTRNRVDDMSFECINCSMLKTIQIGRLSFYCYTTFKLQELPSLQQLTVGPINIQSVCFLYADLILKNLPALQNIQIGDFSFGTSVNTVIENLPSLESICFGRCACYKNALHETSLLLRNLPSLTKLIMPYYSFDTCEEVIIENVPNVNEIDIAESFLHINSVYTQNAECIINANTVLTKLTSE